MCRCLIHIKRVAPAQYFMTKDAGEFSEFDGHVTSRGDTKIGPVLEVVTEYHQGKPGVEIRIESLFKDGSHPWIRICNGHNKFVKDLTEKIRIHEDNEDTFASTEKTVPQDSRIVENSQIRADKPAAKAKPKPISSPSSSSSQMSIPIPGEHTHKDSQSYPVSKRIIALLRHGPLLRDGDGAIEFRRLEMELRSGFPNSENWSTRLWTDHLQKNGGQKKRFQFCIHSTGEQILYLRAIQGHSGENPVDPSCQDNVLIPDNFFEYHVGCYFNMHSIIASGLIAGGKKAGRDRQTVFFTALDPLDTHCDEQKEIDLTKPRLAAYKQTWKVHQDAVYRVDIGLAQRMGWLKFFQTRSNAIILYDTLFPICVDIVVSMKTKEVFHTKTSRSPRPVPTVTFQANWQKDWSFDAAATSSTRPIQPKDQLANTVKPRHLKESYGAWSRKHVRTHS